MSKSAGVVKEGEPCVIEHAFYDKDDFTFYVENIPGIDHDIKYQDCTVTLHDSTKPEPHNCANGRALICRCFGDRRWSVTFRRKGQFQREQKNNASPYPEDQDKKKELPPSGYKPTPTSPHKRFFNTLDEATEILFRLIFLPDRIVSGVLVITGATASAKSQIARRLLHKYIGLPAVREHKDRHPHLVTFEDPIEEEFHPMIDSEFANLVDYTPRQKDRDAKDLREVTKNALRQTPSALFVGEIRNRKDWKPLLAFAATGHFVITTAHAGSLSEAIGAILAAASAHTPADRKNVSDRLLAVLHIAPQEITPGGQGPAKTIMVPALWRGSATARQALMADGRASLVPQNPGPEQYPDNEDYYCLGRSWFAWRLIDQARERTEFRTEVGKNDEKKFLKRMTALDLERR